MKSSVLLTRTDRHGTSDKLKVRFGSNVSRIASLTAGSTVPDDSIVNIFTAMGAADWWSGLTDVHVGKSLADDCDPTVIDGLVGAAKLAAGRDLTVHWAEKPAGISAGPFAQWLQTTFGSGATPLAPPDRKDFEYFIAGGSYRANCILEMLAANFAGRRFDTILDVGAGIGAMTYFIADKQKLGVGTARMIEPLEKRAKVAEEFWKQMLPRPDMKFIVQRPGAQADPFDYPVDLIFTCQAFYYIPRAERKAVVDRWWKALRPGGVIILLEDITDEPETVEVGHPLRPILRRPEVASYFEGYAPVNVFVHKDRWKSSRVLMHTTKADFTAGSMMVAHKAP
ncbi:MAG TPA: class I SAM-dependent methyltransferase [Rhizomicrobium sp.]|jgi:SAM-dependent methyltransferase|nr:class I SAM-dependent methyltransferase [Rhizomicrobium sp.]